MKEKVNVLAKKLKPYSIPGGDYPGSCINYADFKRNLAVWRKPD